MESNVAIAAGFVTVLAAIGALFIKVITIAAQQGANTLKLDTLWKMFEASATAEVVSKGFMKMNSPLVATKISNEAFSLSGLQHDLQDFYKAEGRYMNEIQLQAEIQKRFGERLLKEIAIPYNLTSGGDIIAALKIAKGETFRGKSSDS